VEILRQLDSMAGHAEQGRPAEAFATASFAIALAEDDGAAREGGSDRACLPALRGEVPSARGVPPDGSRC
jgi:hypothetical protein